MQRELGAESTVLLDRQGQVVVQAGALDAIDLKAALPSLLTATEAALEVSRTLGDQAPASLIYFGGVKHDLYLATAGTEHALAVVFPARQGSEQIGAVLQYSRRAASDLMSALYGVRGGSPPARSAGEAAGRGAASIGGERVSAEEGQRMEPRKKPKPKPPETKKQPDLGSTPGETDADAYWDQAARSGDTGPISEDTLTYDEARRRGLLPAEPED
jgi:hypothetical protein